MAKFITTVELFGSSDSEFEQLKKTLANQDFQFEKVVVPVRKDTQSKKAKYKIAGNFSVEDVSRSVVRLLSGSRRQYSFTIVKAAPHDHH